MEKEHISKVIKKYVFIVFIILSIIFCLLLIVRYNVEGEQNLPFKPEKIIIKSSLDTKTKENEDITHLSIVQHNDIYIWFKNNKDIDKEIEKIKIDNIKIKRAKEIGNTKLLIPTSNTLDQMFQNSKEDHLSQGIEYTLNTIDNPEKLEISQDGGMLAFRLSNQDLAEYILDEKKPLRCTGNSLSDMGISEEEIKITASMDITIQVDSKEKYKGTFTIDLPIEDFGDQSIKNKEITDLSNIIFKRTK